MALGIFLNGLQIFWPREQIPFSSLIINMIYIEKNSFFQVQDFIA